MLVALPREDDLKVTSLSLSHRMDHRFDHPSFGSSRKDKTLQLQELQSDLLLEGHFHDLDVRSLTPSLAQVETAESLQLFLDMTNASIDASKANAKPIQNSPGFLFAQLRAAYTSTRPPALRAALEEAAAQRIQPRSAVSQERQLEVHREEILRECFEQGRGKFAPSTSSQYG